jgi:predicted Fe-Mo cluster-binding NifX family protein
MKIAVTFEEGQVFQHFGHTSQFKIYDLEEGKISASNVVDTNGQGHGTLAGFLTDHQVEVLICGGIGAGAQEALAESGIQLFGGVTGDADEAIKAYLDNQLDYNPDITCSHHDHEHQDGDHTCGSHGCGNHGQTN